MKHRRKTTVDALKGVRDISTAIAETAAGTIGGDLKAGAQIGAGVSIVAKGAVIGVIKGVGEIVGTAV